MAKEISEINLGEISIGDFESLAMSTLREDPLSERKLQLLADAAFTRSSGANGQESPKTAFMSLFTELDGALAEVMVAGQQR